MRRSTPMPAWVRARAPAVPEEVTRSISSSPARLCEQGVGIVGGGHDVDVLDAVGAAAYRARELDRRGLAGSGEQSGSQGLADRHGPGQQHPARAIRGLALCLLQRGEHALLELRPEPLDRSQPLSLGGLPQRRRRVDAQLGVEQPCPLRAQAREAGEGDQPRRELRPQPLGRGDLARLGEGQDLLLQGLSDPGQLAGAALPCQPGDRHRGLADGLGGRAVCDHAVDDRPVELVEVAQFLEGVGDLGIGRVVRHGSSLGPAGGRPHGAAPIIVATL